MVGGKIIEIRKLAEKTLVWCIDNYDECAVYVAAVPAEARPGDSFWWQGRHAYWTPKDRSKVDVPLDRIGFSFDPRRR
jgi:hypothetical protein